MDKGNTMIALDELMNEVKTYIQDPDSLALIEKAYRYAQGHHQGQFRRSGEPYMIHAAQVGYILATMKVGPRTICAGLLHDVLEDCGVSAEQMSADFDEEITMLVEGVTKIGNLKFKDEKEYQAANHRKIFIAMANDIRVIVIKLVDRLHNMRTLQYMPPEKQQKIAAETLQVYAPIAHRLGISEIKNELEDLSFYYLDREKYYEIAHLVEEKKAMRDEQVKHMIRDISEMLKEKNIEFRIFGRSKHLYSIYKKMKTKNKRFEEILDLLAIRIVTQTKLNCYEILGYIHAAYRPIPGRLKDYIAVPKSNMYQSLHTTIVGDEGRIFEIQIRTEEMHRLAEHGVASHWLYKERHHAVSVKDAPEFEWLREIVNRQGQESDSKEFMHTLRMDLFKDEVYVFTPAGDVKELPEGATPLDFAFLIHTQVGSRCVGAKVNGKLVPLNTALKSGDTVEIITDKNRRPSRDWLKIVKTAKARSRIQQYLRTEERAAAMGLGREMLEKEARKAGINLSKAEKDGHLSTLVNSLAAGSVDELMASIGYARFTTKQVVKRLQAIVSPPEILETPDAVDTVVSHRKRKEQSPPPPPKTGGISVRGVDDMMVRIAHCCNPVPGDSIVGFISRGRGVIVHTATCPNIQEMEPDRLVSVQWDGHETQPFPVRIHIMARNQKGSLADIAIVLRDEDVNIDGCLLQALVDGRSEREMVVQVRDVAHLYHVIDRLRHLPSVMEVLRKTANEE